MVTENSQLKKSYTPPTQHFLNIICHCAVSFKWMPLCEQKLVRKWRMWDVQLGVITGKGISPRNEVTQQLANYEKAWEKKK